MPSVTPPAPSGPSSPDEPGAPSFLLPVVLEANPGVRRALAAVVPDPESLPDWDALALALSGGPGETLASTFPGNKSERLILAALLSKADHAPQAARLGHDFWFAWHGLDRRNKALVLALLDEDLG